MRIVTTVAMSMLIAGCTADPAQRTGATRPDVTPPRASGETPAGTPADAMAITPATAWTRIDGVPVLRPVAERYATIEAIGDTAAGTAPWTVAAEAQNARSVLTAGAVLEPGDAPAWRWDLAWTGTRKLEYGEIVCDRIVPARTAAVGFLIHQAAGSTRPAMRLRLVDASGEIHQFTAVVRQPAAASGWFPVVIDLAKADAIWAGDGNKRLDPPLRLHSLLADRPGGGFTGEVALGLRSIAFQAAVPAPLEAKLSLEVADAPIGHLYPVGATVRLRARMRAGRFSWMVSDLAGAVLAQGSATAPEAQIRLPLVKPGWYDCTITAESGAARSVRAYRCAALPAGPAPRHPALGVCTHLHRLGNWPSEALALVPRLGFSAIRDELSWGMTEPEMGRLAVPSDRAWFIAEAARLGLEPLLILCYSHPGIGGAWPVTAEARAAFAAWAGRFAAATTTVRAFEIWNEWSAGTGIPTDRRTPAVNTPEAYAALLAETSAAVRRARPDATIVGIGGEHAAYHRDAWTRMMAAGAGPAMDVASFHPYRWQSDPESTHLAEEVTAAAAQVKAAGGSGRLWITEIGWTSVPSGPDGSDVRSHGRHTLRALTLLASVPAVERTFLYDLMDDGRDPLEMEHHFGLVHHRSLGLMPKPAAVAVATFSRMTAGAACLGRVNRGDAWAVLFRSADGGDLAIAWSAGAPARLGSVLSGIPVSAMDAGGASLERIPDELGAWPVYIRGQALKAAP